MKNRETNCFEKCKQGNKSFQSQKFVTTLICNDRKAKMTQQKGSGKTLDQFSNKKASFSKFAARFIANTDITFQDEALKGI